ncbi:MULTISPECIES: hypothetical protein [unclassified Dehalobacter]|uniref:hypothetical protein n=1 Tax=unclassified Dehalobacter TaxID=2635733 RepID=UPI0003759D30|nr:MULTISPECIES: hypothetical protein [unclassified Dehalobacter]RJE46878.1 hypothetical protein A7K50_05090 [Dehalobacter sp. MCB1]TCX50801.1 hypothetical protein C1I38_11345 [Dehalobacter sp. 12DCB1]TCX51512.1 hypothetical protein C1I36_04045 [Dehalobacter sp. 14DCB1]
MENQFAELYHDFEMYQHCQLIFSEQASDGIKIQQISYDTFKPIKDDNGILYFPMNELGFGYFITNNFNIVKMPSKQKKAMYRIEKDGEEYFSIYLFGPKN